MNINTFGTLYIVATPIGNLQDITFRAIETLKSVSLIVAEDTRHSQPLLQHYAINTKILTLHEHNERESTEKLLNQLKQGLSIALISDAGTPLISDPGFHLVKAARAGGIKVVPLPGPCAAIAAMSVSGVATDRFVFEGFLPAKAGARKLRLEKLRNEERTMIFYEAPHRIQALLQDMLQVFGSNRMVVMARELTKLFETITAQPLAALIAWVDADTNQRRGEIVVIVEGKDSKTEENEPSFKHTLAILLDALPLKQAVEVTMKLTGQKKNTVYETALQLKNKSEDT
jgi:16S rRNA (cytidine1402-2'-O)-methyltransferase